jgi:Predicted membrane protein
MVILGCLVSILAILIELTSLKHLTGTPRVLHLLLTGTTLAVSWALLPTSFAMHYAHHHYLHRSKDVTPMIFPEKPEEPGYWDFLYFSFTIAVASQTADVATGTTDMIPLP